MELAGVGEMGDGAVELQLAAAMGESQLFEEAAAKEAGQDLDGGEEGAAPGLPLAALDIEARVGAPARPDWRMPKRITSVLHV